MLLILLELYNLIDTSGGITGHSSSEENHRGVEINLNSGIANKVKAFSGMDLENRYGGFLAIGLSSRKETEASADNEENVKERREFLNCSQKTIF